MSEYDFQPGGSLKLKGVANGGVKKKKKKSSKSKEKKKVDAARERLQEKDAGVASGSNTPDSNGRNSSSRKTEAERRFEEAQRERLAQKVAKLAPKTHKDRVNEFNNKLEALSEHHDIPKVGPG